LAAWNHGLIDIPKFCAVFGAAAVCCIACEP
jgi:hypothetical protein